MFKSLADDQDGIRYLKEDTIARFLGIPDILGVSSVLFQMVSYIGAFPFLQDAPAVLGLEQMVIVLAILTNRYKQVLVKGANDRRKLLFGGLAVYDRKLSTVHQGALDSAAVEADGPRIASTHPPCQGSAVDIAQDEEGDDWTEDDELILSALDALDYVGGSQRRSDSTMHGAMIPADNFRKFIMLLLLISPLDEQENLSSYVDRISGSELESLRERAECILAAFLDVEKSPGIKLSQFNAIVPISMPYLFDGLAPLFEHFLFSKRLDLNQHKGEAPPLPVTSLPQPLLQETGSIMNLSVLSQLSLFIPGTSLFRRVRQLYSGDDDGFSMGSFESKVFNWRAPTILLVSGIRLPAGSTHMGSCHESGFLSTLPPRRFPSGGSEDAEQLTFGIYLGQPWKYTNRECFGGDDTILFQLEPIHDVFLPSNLNKEYISYIKPSSSTNHAGLSIGCPPPQPAQTFRRSNNVLLGPISLVLDSSFEYGCFTHDQSLRGGAFQPSPARRFNFQDRFEVTHLEVWGCGGDEEAKIQAERWAWEAREAEARRTINLGTGDIEADRALLEMAGLIGANRSGGSMG